MIYIGVDGGGSSCRFCLIDGARQLTHMGGAANIATDFDAAVQVLRNGLSALSDQSGIVLDRLVAAPMHLGLAGLLGPEDGLRLRHVLGWARATISDDQAIAIRGALGARDGVVIGLGTGSFIARQDQGATTRLGGWGLALGDEASGAWLGRGYLAAVALAQDGFAPATPQSRAILDRMGGAGGMARFAATASPADFAALAPEIFGFATQGDDLARMLIEGAVSYLTKALALCGWRQDLPICLIGGLSAAYRPHLPAPITAQLIAPAGTPMDGALAMAREAAA